MTEEKKLYIDEDWKSQVEAEKEANKKDDPSRSEQTSHVGGPLPPASFEMLLTSLATEAMMHLGQIPNPVSGKPQIDLPHARYTIDMLEVLESKTQGNLSAEESNAISTVLHQLRMAFVAVQSQQGAAPAEG